VHRSQHPHLATAPNGQVTDSAFRNAAMSAATDAATTALSYSYTSFDADRARARALMSPKLAKQYDGAMDQVAAQTASAKLTLKATVLSAGLLSAEEHDAKVLLFVNTVTTREGSKKQQLDQNRVVMDLTRKDGGWIVSKMDAF
jgi:Mce-associated membrane protein